MSNSELTYPISIALERLQLLVEDNAERIAPGPASEEDRAAMKLVRETLKRATGPEVLAPPQERAGEAFASLPDHWMDAIGTYTVHGPACPHYTTEGGCECAVETFRSSLFVIIAEHLGLLPPAEPEG